MNRSFELVPGYLALLAGLALSAACGPGADGDLGCYGCVAGNAGNGDDDVQLGSVTGLDDGVDDHVTVAGTYTLASAAEAILTAGCDGDYFYMEPGPVPEGTQPFSTDVSFGDCDPDVVKVELRGVGAQGEDVYADCCFRRGVDF